MSTALQPTTLPKKHYRLKLRPVPVRVLDSVQIFQLAEVLDSAESALVVWTLRGWIAHNEAKNQRHNYREGRWWTYNSLPRWCETHFKWLSAKQLGTVMARLEKQGVIVRKQFKVKHEFDNQYWYTVDEVVLSALVAAKQTPIEPSSDSGASSAQTGTSSAHLGASRPERGASSAQTVSYTTQESSTQESSINNLKTPTTTPAFKSARKTAVGGGVAAAPTRPEPESGEYSFDGEGPQPQAARDTDTVDAALPLSPRSAGPLSPLTDTARGLVDTLMAHYERTGLTEDYAARLISNHGEDHVRAVHQHVQVNWRLYSAGHTSRIYNPPGFMTGELATRRLNLPPVPYTPLGDMESDSGSHPFNDLSAAESESDDLPGEPVTAPADSIPSAPPVIAAPPAPVATDTADSRAHTAWRRALAELPQYCGRDADVIAAHTRLVTYEPDMARFIVQTTDAPAYTVLQRHAGTLKTVLSRITGGACRIKHQEQVGT